MIFNTYEINNIPRFDNPSLNCPDIRESLKEREQKPNDPFNLKNKDKISCHLEFRSEEILRKSKIETFQI